MRKYNLDSNKEHLRKVFPSAADLPERNPYEPTRFENALGKLQVTLVLIYPHPNGFVFITQCILYVGGKCIGSETGNGHVSSSILQHCARTK